MFSKILVSKNLMRRHVKSFCFSTSANRNFSLLNSDTKNDIKPSMSVAADHDSVGP